MSVHASEMYARNLQRFMDLMKGEDGALKLDWDDEIIAGYHGTLFWGGPVQMDSLRALLYTDDPPDEAEKIIESVYLVSFDDAVDLGPTDPARLRLYIGYAGWAPGQLDYELTRGSWRILPATREHVFADKPRALWKQLTPAEEQRAAVTHLFHHFM